MDRLPFARIFPTNILLYYVALCLYIVGEIIHARFVSQKFKFYDFLEDVLLYDIRENSPPCHMEDQLVASGV